MLYSILLLVSSCPFAIAAAYRNVSVETTTLGGSHLSLDQVVISKRQDLDCISYHDCQMMFDEHLPVDTVNDLPKKPKEHSASAVKVDPVRPFGNAQCEPRPSGRYKDSHGWAVQGVSREFCNAYCASEDADPAILPIRKLFVGRSMRVGFTIEDWGVGYLRHQQVHASDDVYVLTVEKVEGCTQEGKLNLRQPADNAKCMDLMHTAWRMCNNKGRGGSLVSGCIRYSISTRF